MHLQLYGGSALICNSSCNSLLHSAHGGFRFHSCGDSYSLLQALLLLRATLRLSAALAFNLC